MSLTQSYQRLEAVRGTLAAVTKLRVMESAKRKSVNDLLSKTRDDVEDFQKAIELCKACIEEQVSAKEHIEKLASAMLTAIGQGIWRDVDGVGQPPVFEFFLEPAYGDGGEVKGLNPKILENGQMEEPEDQAGWAQNVASFAIRLSYLLLNPGLSQTMILDEPMTNLSPMGWQHLVRFLEDLLKDLPLQIICITHSGAEFPCTYRITKRGDTSRAERIN